MKPEAAVCGCVELVSKSGKGYVCLCLTGTIPVTCKMYNTNVQFMMSTSIWFKAALAAKMVHLLPCHSVTQRYILQLLSRVVFHGGLFFLFARVHINMCSVALSECNFCPLELVCVNWHYKLKKGPFHQTKNRCEPHVVFLYSFS